MDGYSTSRIDDLPQIWDGWGKLVREGLGLSSFGVNVIDVPADTRCLDHTEAASRQEELYTALRGSCTLLIGEGDDADAERVPVSSETVTNASFVSSTRASMRRMLEPSPAIAWVTSASRPGRSSVDTSSSIA